MKILSHEKLGITFQELGALLGTLSMLENGVIHRTKKSTIAAMENGEHLFNMDTWRAEHRCGTVTCIGGTMDIIMGSDPEPQDRDDVKYHPFNELFFPNRGRSYTDGNYQRITVPQTIKTIKTFLRTGKVNWSHANPRKR